MARHRIGVLDHRENPATTVHLGEEQARVRRRIEALESAGDRSVIADGGSRSSVDASHAAVTESSEATDEEVAAAVRTFEDGALRSFEHR